MTKNSKDITLADLLPTDRKYLMDEDEKIGKISFTAAEKRELLKTIGTPGWEIIKGVYVKQRLVQVAVASVNVSQTAEDLMFYKGKSAEANELVRQIEAAANSLRKEEDDKNKPQS